MTNETHGAQGSGAAYQSIGLYRAAKQYGDLLAEAVRHIKAYSPEDLEKKGIVKNGKVNAEGLWAYVNHLAEEKLGAQNLDSKDPRLKASYAQIKNVVGQFGSKGLTGDLVEAVIGQYLSVANSYADERSAQTFASLTTNEGKAQVQRLAELTGQAIPLKYSISGINEPTDVAQVASQMLPRLRENVTTSSATGTIDDLVAAAANSSQGHGTSAHLAH